MSFHSFDFENVDMHKSLKDLDKGEKQKRGKDIETIDIIAQGQQPLIIEGIEVYFPYSPYKEQLDYMQQVIQGLNKKQNVLIQSPTGTGKTLCLLCATLGWLRKKRQDQIKNREKDPIRIVYSSRTHSQLKQVVAELKRTVYQPSITILASRDQYCIKKEFQYVKGQQLISSCMKACKGIDTEFTCGFFKGMHNDINENFEGKIMDIEELKIEGRNEAFCPYYHSRRIKDKVDIVFMPYNYLLDLNSFPIFTVELKDAVIIFDEAHNTLSCSEEGASFSLSLRQLKTAEEEIKKLQDHLIHNFKDPSKTTQFLKKKLQTISEIDTQGLRSTKQDCENILLPIQALKKYMVQQIQRFQQEKGMQNFQTQGDQGYTYEGKQIFEIIEKETRTLNVGSETKSLDQSLRQSSLEESLENYVYNGKKQFSDQPQGNFKDGIKLSLFGCYLEKIAKMIEDLSTTQNFGLDSLQAFLKGVYQLRLEDIDSSQKQEKEGFNKAQFIKNAVNHYKLFVKVQGDDCSFNLWCLDPSQSFKKLLDKLPYNIILTSGTLTPIRAWEQELKIPFPVQFINGHVVDVKTNLLACILKKGPTAEPFTFSYGNKDNQKLYSDIGNSIFLLCGKIPNGVLIIFSSYSVLTRCLQQWHSSENGIYKRINEVKPIFEEPKLSSELETLMFNYKKACRTKKGAILMAVCRGKISEGIDFSDELARAVFMIGVPYPPFTDIKVDSKKKYLNDIKSYTQNIQPNQTSLEQQVNCALSGDEWYTTQAIRAMNQAIGRVIRHKNDFGAIFMCDIRFDNPNLKNQVSHWCQSVLKPFDSFKEALIETQNFFELKASQENQGDKVNNLKKMNKMMEEQDEQNENSHNFMDRIKNENNENSQQFNITNKLGQNFNNSFKIPNPPKLGFSLKAKELDEIQEKYSQNSYLPDKKRNNSFVTSNLTISKQTQGFQKLGSFQNQFQNMLQNNQNESPQSARKLNILNKFPQQKNSLQENKKKFLFKENSQEIDETLCLFCQTKNLKKPLKNKACGHVACSNCWFNYQEIKSNLCCQIKIEQKNLVPFQTNQ